MKPLFAGICIAYIGGMIALAGLLGYQAGTRKAPCYSGYTYKATVVGTVGSQVMILDRPVSTNVTFEHMHFDNVRPAQ